MFNVNLNKQLPCKLKLKYNFKWHVKNLKWSNCLSCISEILVKKNKSTAEEGLLKLSKNRYILRYENECHFESLPASVIVKGFPMSKIKQRIYKYFKYGHAEFNNLNEALYRGLPAPKVFALGVRKNVFFVNYTALVIEDFKYYIPISEVLRNNCSDSVLIKKVLEKVGVLLIELYNKACNHIDVNPDNILYSYENDDLRIIDFMYVNFMETPSNKCLAFNASYFSEGVKSLIGEELILDLKCNIASLANLDKNSFLNCCKHFSKNKLSRADRLKIAGNINGE
ncbi:lipopolysaccharide kinase InaA family protein [Verrucomicrobia bacterium]|nr:lipopolysaccharide kinase InaA family protein [Verrucomicrobiota bacterium]